MWVKNVPPFSMTTAAAPVSTAECHTTALMLRKEGTQVTAGTPTSERTPVLVVTLRAEAC